MAQKSPWKNDLFEVKGLLGQGFFGKVYKARHVLGQMCYAVKQVFIDKTLKYAHERNHRPLFREIKALQELEHPNVVRYHYSWLEAENEEVENQIKEGIYSPNSSFSSTQKENNFLFIQMELCDSTLEDFLKENLKAEDRLPDCSQILLQIAEALSYLHSKSVIHRDLKPNNIFRRENIWKLGDFGLSKFCDESSSGLSQSDYKRGCFKYQSPDKKNTMKSDVYTFGLISLEIMYPKFVFFLPTDNWENSTLWMGKFKTLFPKEFHDLCQLVYEMLCPDETLRLDSITVLTRLKNTPSMAFIKDYNGLNRMPGTISHQFGTSVGHSTQICPKDKLNRCNNEISSLFTNEGFKIKHNFQEPVSHYISRPLLEQEIISALQNKPTCNGQINFPIVILHGIGGNGKTTLTRKIIKLCADNNYFGGNSVWINAEYEENIKNELLEILDTKKDDVKNNIKKKLDTLFFPRPCLLVFDNVDDYQMLLSYLPLNLETNTSVLITSNAVWESGDFGEVKHISVNNFTAEEFSEFAKSKIKDVKRKEIEILADYTGRFPYLANIVLSGAAIWKKRHVGIEIIQYLDINDKKLREVGNLIYKRSPKEIVERQINLIQECFEEDGEVAYKILCVFAYCQSDLSGKAFQRIISAHEGFKLLVASKSFQNVEDAINVGARILVEQGFFQQFQMNEKDGKVAVSYDFDNTDDSEDSENAGLTSCKEIYSEDKNYDTFFVPNIHRSHQIAIRTILKEKGDERCEIEQILALDSSAYKVVDADLLWKLGTTYGDEILKLMFDSPHFLFNLVEYEVNDGIKKLVKYAKETKTEEKFLEWVLFNQEPSETIESPLRIRRLFGVWWEYYEIYFEDFGHFFQKVKSVLKNSDIKEIFTSYDFVSWGVNDNFDWMDLVFKDYANFIAEKVGKCQESFLHVATDLEKIEAIEYFIRRGVEVNAQNYEGHTALHYAAYFGTPEIMKRLLGAGADPNIANNTKQTPLFFAVSVNNVDGAKCLLSQNADPNLQDIYGDTPLIWAGYRENLDMMEILLEYGADLNIHNNYGETALHLAVFENKLKVVNFLISKKADPKFKIIKGDTALQFAASEGKQQIIETLLKSAGRKEGIFSPDSSLSSIQEENNFLFIQMELCDSTLEDFLKENPNAKARLPGCPQILLQTAEALSYLHRRNVMHRNLKKNNIFRRVNIWKIADFGLSKFFYESDAGLSRSDNKGGCFKYQSPDKKNTMKSDVYTFTRRLIILEIMYPKFGVFLPTDVWENSTLWMGKFKALFPKEFRDLCQLVYEMLCPDETLRLDSITVTRLNSTQSMAFIKDYDRLNRMAVRHK